MSNISLYYIWQTALLHLAYIVEQRVMWPLHAVLSEKRLVSLCVGCGNQIHDQYILRVSPDLEWHAACLKCAECSQYLDESCTCFVRDGKTYCKRDYIRQDGGTGRLSHDRSWSRTAVGIIIFINISQDSIEIIWADFHPAESCFQWVNMVLFYIFSLDK